MTDTIAREDELLSPSEIRPQQVEEVKILACPEPECGKSYRSSGALFAHRAAVHGYKSSRPKKTPAKKPAAPKAAAPKQPAAPVARRKPAGDLIGEVFGFGAPIVQAFDPLIGNCIEFEAEAIGAAVDKVAAGTFVDKRLLQPLVNGTGKYEDLAAVASLPLLLLLVRAQPGLIMPLEQPLRNAIGRVLVAKLPVLKRRAEEERKVTNALAELGALDERFAESADPVGQILASLLGSIVVEEPASADDGE